MYCTGNTLIPKCVAILLRVYNLLAAPSRNICRLRYAFPMRRAIFELLSRNTLKSRDEFHHISAALGCHIAIRCFGLVHARMASNGIDPSSGRELANMFDPVTIPTYPVSTSHRTEVVVLSRNGTKRSGNDRDRELLHP